MILIAQLLFVVGSVLAVRGPMTWYRTGLNACGYVNFDGDPIVAVSTLGHDGLTCGSKIRVSANGVTAVAYVADHCRNCATNQIDASPGLALLFGPLGNVVVDWELTSEPVVLVDTGVCGGPVQCTGAQTYCFDGVCVPLPELTQTDILVGGPGFEYEQCSGLGFPEPLVCPAGFSCVDMGTWGRAGYGQCLPGDVSILARPAYIEPSAPRTTIDTGVPSTVVLGLSTTVGQVTTTSLVGVFTSSVGVSSPTTVVLRTSTDDDRSSSVVQTRLSSISNSMTLESRISTVVDRSSSVSTMRSKSTTLSDSPAASSYTSTILVSYGVLVVTKTTTVTPRVTGRCSKRKRMLV